ncbi:AGAP008013-PA, partial [Anopheles gambiae str. PEST]
RHYSQHESSVNAARKAAAERLQQHQAAALVAGSGSSTGPCDTLCYNSYAADAGSDAETIGQGIVGFTSTGAAGAVGSSQKYSASSSRVSESSVQNVAVPVVYPAVASTAGTRSSYSSSSSSRQQKVHSSAGVAQPVSGALYSADHGLTRSSIVQPVVYPVAAPQTHAAQSSYERSSSERSQVVQPVTYPAANNDYSRRYIAQQDHTQYRQYPSTSNTYVLYSKPITSSVQYYAPSRSRTEEAASTTSYDASGRVVNLNIAQPVHSERVNEQRSQQRAESVQTVQRQSDLYPVRAGYDHQEKEAVQHHQEVDYEDTVDTLVTDRPVRLLTPTVPAAASASSQRRTEQQSSYVRTGSYVPNTGSSTRYNTAQSVEGQRRQTYHSAPTYVAPVPVTGSVSSSKYESAAESQQRHTQNSLNVPIVVQPAPVSASSTASRYASTAHEQRTGASGPVYYAPAAGASTYGSQYSNTAASSSHNSRYKAGSAGGFVHYPIANDDFGRRFGAVGGAGGFGAETDLQDIMSESEALARLQAQNVHNGAVTGSGTIDAETRFGGESDGLGTMPGGYQRTKSWSSSSKWASEQRYGDDGKPKTFNMLSTAESEKHNINGKTTGYKAATTTLDDDGKVSTYSLHTT